MRLGKFLGPRGVNLDLSGPLYFPLPRLAHIPTYKIAQTTIYKQTDQVVFIIATDQPAHLKADTHGHVVCSRYYADIQRYWLMQPNASLSGNWEKLSPIGWG